MMASPEPALAETRRPLTTRSSAGLQRCGGTTCPPGTCAHDDEPTVSRLASGPGPGRAPALVGAVLGSPGRPLPPAVRTTMEARLGHDFGSVRVHADDQAARSARAVHALAWTVGSDIAFDAGRYDPASEPGQRLLAHELAHVVQQRDVAAPAAGADLPVSDAADPAEREAEVAASHAHPSREADAAPQHARHGGLSTVAAAGVMLERQEAAEPPMVGAPPGQCPSRCGGVPSHCPLDFCCPLPFGTATVVRDAIKAPFLIGIAANVSVSVVPVWNLWFDGGTSTLDFTGAFGAEFARDGITARVSRELASGLASELDPTRLQALATSAAPGASVSLLPALPPDYLASRTRSMEDEAGGGPLLMNFSGIGTVPGNLAGGVGKTQRTCAVGATPSTVDDARQLRDASATLVRNPNGSVTVTPAFRFHVVDTVDLCPGNCGARREQRATVPMSRLEASGVSGDVPFTVDFGSGPQARFTVGPPAPPTPVNVTVSGSVLFDFGSDTLRPGAEPALLAQLGSRPLHADLTQPFVVAGHTDSRGSDAVNQPLSERRARRVADVLERNFPNLVGNIAAVGFGETRPVAPNEIGGVDNPSGRALNRRVEISFSAPPGP